MRARAILLASLGLNLILASLLYFSEEPATRTIQGITKTKAIGIPAGYRTNVVVRRQNFSWREIESPDYPTYISNLRSIGCPEPTIRDIIVADVNELFARRRATEIVTSNQQWWRSEPDLDVLEAAAAKSQTLDAERRLLLTQLLGPNWEATAAAVASQPRGRPLDGPILGPLSTEIKAALHEIEARAEKRQQDYIAAREKEGHPLDRAELARFRQQTRAELAKLLSPTQLEEYLLRYSHTAERLRAELGGLQLSPEEFKTIFRLRDPLDQQADLYGSGADPTSAKRQAELAQQQDNTLKQALGPERYAYYKKLQDPLFRQAKEMAEGIGAPAEVVEPIRQIDEATEIERFRIQSDPSLSEEEQAAALRTVLTQQQQSYRKILGPEAYERWRQTQQP